MGTKKEILTQERLKELLNYNPGTGKFIWKVFRDIKAKPGDVAGTLNDQGYIIISIDRRGYRAHRLAWLYVHGKWPKHHIDHCDHDRSNNKMGNLREATRIDNQRNMSLGKDNTSGTTGVNWNKALAKWAAKIQIDGKSKHLGYFTAKEAAILARADANIKYGFHINHGK